MHSGLDFRPVQIITGHVVYNSPYKYWVSENGPCPEVTLPVAYYKHWYRTTISANFWISGDFGLPKLKIWYLEGLLKARYGQYFYYKRLNYFSGFSDLTSSGQPTQNFNNHQVSLPNEDIGHEINKDSQNSLEFRNDLTKKLPDPIIGFNFFEGKILITG